MKYDIRPCNFGALFDPIFLRKIAGAQGAGGAIEDLEDPKAKAGRYLQKLERLDTTGSNLNNPSVT